MDLLQLVNPEEITDYELQCFSYRTAVLGIVFDDNDNVALLGVAGHQYHRLPGGRVDEDEDVRVVLESECEAQIGSNIDIGNEVGKIVEYRRRNKLVLETYAYIASIEGEKETSSFDEEEVQLVYSVLWVPLDDAIELLASDAPDEYSGSFIIARDLLFLREVKRISSEE